MQDQENWYQELEQRKELEREAKNGSGIIGFLFLIFLSCLYGSEQ